jgi:hypothetical protein
VIRSAGTTTTVCIIAGNRVFDSETLTLAISACLLKQIQRPTSSCPKLPRSNAFPAKVARPWPLVHPLNCVGHGRVHPRGLNQQLILAPVRPLLSGRIWALRLDACPATCHQLLLRPSADQRMSLWLRLCLTRCPMFNGSDGFLDARTYVIGTGAFTTSIPHWCLTNRNCSSGNFRPRCRAAFP